MSDKTIKVSNTADLRTAIEAGYTKDQIEIVTQDNTAALAAARAEGVTAGRAEATTNANATHADIEAKAAKAERERLIALQAIARPGFEALLATAIETGQTKEQFAFAQMEEANTRGITLDAIKKDSKAAPHANAPNTSAKAEAKAGWGKAAAKISGTKAA
jgi:hypothetical protein